jgi:hypothetical protein
LVASLHDVNILEQIIWEAGTFYLMHRATLTSPAGIESFKAALSSSPEPSKTFASPAAIPGPWTTPPACFSTRPW